MMNITLFYDSRLQSPDWRTWSPLCYHCLAISWFEKTKTVCTMCVACVDSRTMVTADCLRKRLNHPPYSPDLSPPDYFAWSWKWSWRGPICNHMRHSNICNIETEDYSYYWFFESNASLGRSQLEDHTSVFS